jgi:broad-specificity NMP kinase
MHIELAGCTSSGKTTLAGRLKAAARAENTPLALGQEVVLSALKLAGVKSSRLQAACLHALAAVGCLRSYRRRRELFAFARQSLQQTPISRGRRLSQLRKVLKQVGCFELIQARRDSNLVVVDEGAIQSAHNLFVHESHPLQREAVLRFAELTPLPDAIVFLRHDEHTLVERTIRRGHPRISKNASRETIAEFVGNAVAAFDLLLNHKRIAPRAVVIDGTLLPESPNELSGASWESFMQLLLRVLSATSDSPDLPAAEMSESLKATAL